MFIKGDIDTYPKKGDRVWHYLKMQPLTVVSRTRSKTNNEIILILESEKGDRTQTEDVGSLRFIPAEGDTVVVLAQAYHEWIRKQIKTQKAAEQSTKALEQELDDFSWMIHEFTIRKLNFDMAIVMGGGVRKTLPLTCLAVLKRKAIEAVKVA